MFLKSIVTILLVYWITDFCFGQEFDYRPGSVSDHQVVEYSQFILSYNELHEQPDWVAYSLDSVEASSSGNRCDCFKSDSQILTKSATSKDYISSGFDRGHLAPSADNMISTEANAESFLMSNISPQTPHLNRGIWANLERWVRQTAKREDIIYVVTGPIFKSNLGSIGDNMVTIPGYFYKVILRFDGVNHTNPKTIGFVLPNLSPTGSLTDYVLSVNAIETLTGIDFFPELPSSVEDRAESQFSPRAWGLD